jgi:hypothetical protein
MGTLVFQANLGGAVNLVGPNTASTVNFTLPSADGTSGQALVTNGTGTLSFSTVAGTPGGSNTQVQFNNSGAFGGSANLTYNGTALNLKGTLLLSGSSSGTVGFAPAAAAGSTTYTLPAADGTNGQSLTTNGAGTLSWASSSGGGFSGANTNAVSSSAITLTSASSQYQVCQISSFTNSYVTLPDATTMTAGSNPFVIENRSPYGANLELRNSAGTTVGYIPIGQIGTVQLKDKSTSAGQWAVELVNPQSFFTYTSASITNVTTTPLPNTNLYSNYGMVGLSATSFVRWWMVSTGLGGSSGTAVLYTQAATISGSTITFGSIQSSTILTAIDTTAAFVNRLNARVIRLSNTAFVVLSGIQSFYNVCGIYYNGSQRILTCTVSGTTVTFGTPSTASMPTTVNTINGGDQANACAINGTICRLSDTVFALLYNDSANTTYSFPYNYSGSISCQIVSVSGTTMTIGTKVNLSTSTYSQVTAAVGLSATQVFLSYCQAAATGGSTGRSKMVVISVSGTTPTFNTPVSCESADVTIFATNPDLLKNCFTDGAVAPSATQVIFNTSYSLGECTISGTVPTFDVFAYSNNSYPLFLSTSSKAWTGNGGGSNKAYFSIATGGFVTSTNIVDVLQTNLAVISAQPWSPLGAQPTTSYIAYKLSSGNSASATVLLGTTT